jgi:hypothetical protein
MSTLAPAACALSATFGAVDADVGVRDGIGGPPRPAGEPMPATSRPSTARRSNGHARLRQSRSAS